MNRLTLFTVSLLIAAIPARGQDVRSSSKSIAPENNPHRVALDGTRTEEIEMLIRGSIEKQGIPGLSVAIGVNNELVYAKAFGQADVENEVPVSTDTRFRTASIAKTMTAVAVMSLVEDSKIDLDAVVQTYCPDYSAKRWPLTTRHLLGHLGGVRHYNSNDEGYSTARFYSLKSALSTFKDDPLLHEPGTKYLYSSFGYNLLGSVAEGASGEKFIDLLQERIFERAEMKSTVVDDQFTLIPHRTRGYERPTVSTVRNRGAEGVLKPGELYNAPFHDTSMKIPGGGLLSTPSELVRFAIALNQNKLLTPATRKLMWTSQTTSDGESTSYGLGWRIKSADSKRIVYHTGAQAGTATVLFLVPESGTAVAIMSNLRGASLYALAASLADAIVPPKNLDGE